MCGIISDLLFGKPRKQKPTEVDFTPPEEIQADVVDEIESAGDTDLERRLRKRRGKRALRAVGLAGIPTSTPSSPTQGAPKGPSGLGGL